MLHRLEVLILLNLRVTKKLGSYKFLKWFRSKLKIYKATARATHSNGSNLKFHEQLTQSFLPQVSYTLYLIPELPLCLKFYRKIGLKSKTRRKHGRGVLTKCWKSATNLSAAQAAPALGSAACCNGQTPGGIADWSAGTDWGYSNKLASKNKPQSERFTTCSFRHQNAKTITRCRTTERWN